MRRVLIVAALSAVAALVLAPAAPAIDKVNTKKLRKGVTVDQVLDHEKALQQIALANNGNRAATRPGYDASVQYVVSRMTQAGYKVRLNEFDFPRWDLNSSSFAETAPTVRTFAEDTDYVVSHFSGSGDVSATVVPTSDMQAPPPDGPGTGTSGCEASDFPAETAGNVALIQRGTCLFTDKFQNAKDAGAAAAIIFNDGGEGREEPMLVFAPPNVGIPTIMVSNDVGESLFNEAQTADVTVDLAVDAVTTANQEPNVIADSRNGNKGRTIIVGAHLDSVEEGPGINDNGSGTSGLIEIAEQISKLNNEPRNRIRFAFWGAEEPGLVGSTAYVDQLTQNGNIDQIEANLNFDMIGSPNFVRFVYDGDLSDSEPPASGAPDGSAQIEQLFLRYFAAQGLPTDPTAFDGRSDYGPFIENGVPAGGLFTGAEEIKTAQQEAIYGGVAGLAFDPCYHQACDTFANVSRLGLKQMSDATAHSVWTLARSQSPVTEAQGARVSKAKVRKRASNGVPFKYQGHLEVR